MIRQLRQVACKSISSIKCDFIVSGEEFTDIEIQFLGHFNEIHDPNFVGKCEDDVRIEYQELLVKLNNILANRNYQKKVSQK